MIKQIKLSKNFLNHFLKDIELVGEHQWKVVILTLIALIYWITNRGRSYIGSPGLIKFKESNKKFCQWWW